MKTDNNATCHFFTQPKLTSKQARWQEFLAEIDFKFEHATLCMLPHLHASQIDDSLCDVLREFLQKDYAAQNVMGSAEASKTRHF